MVGQVWVRPLHALAWRALVLGQRSLLGLTLRTVLELQLAGELAVGPPAEEALVWAKKGRNDH